MSDPWFDPTTHRYFCGQLEWPGVTRVLKHAGHIDMAWFTEAARNKGTRVHEATLAFDLNLQEHIDPSTDIIGELEAYQRFLCEERPEFLCAEEPRFHKVLRYGGIPDRICKRLRGFPAVIEIKTGEPADWHRFQLAGYQLLHPAGARWVLYLRPNGRYRLRRCDDPTDYATFTRALSEYWRAA